MDERALGWALLVELDAYRRLDPANSRLMGQIDLAGFLARNDVSWDAYVPVVEDLRNRGFVAEPQIDHLSVANGGMYLTTAGLDALNALRANLDQTAAALQPFVPAGTCDIIQRAWPTFRDKGTFPAYRAVEKSLRFANPPDTDIQSQLRQLPPWMGYAFAEGPTGVVSIGLLGLVICVGDAACTVLESFWRAVTLARSKYLASANNDLDPKLSSGELGGSGTEGNLGLAEPAIRGTFAILQSEMLLSGGYSTDDHNQYGWEYQIADRIYAYRYVETLEEYVRIRAREQMQLLQGQGHARSVSMTPTHQSPDPRKVFVIHGRDTEARDALCDFLKDLDLHPMDWEELVVRTGKGTPYTGEVVDQAFREAQAVIALLTPDDEVRLHEGLWQEDEKDDEKELQGQPRPNVYFEAGMAFMAQPERTILVEIGQMRSASDLGGRNVVRLSDSPVPLNALKSRLKDIAKCQVIDTASGWLDTSRFAALDARTRHQKIKGARKESLPTGSILGSAPRAAAPGLRATLYRRSANEHLLEVANSGGVTLRHVHWQLSTEAVNWSIMADVLPTYPVPELPPRDKLPRIPVAVTMGGPPIVELTLRGTQPDGALFETKATLSIWG